MNPLTEGTKTPLFTLKNQNGEKVSLKDFIGKKNIVIYFYPKALTPGCTTHACGITDSKKEFANLDTVIFGISPDPVEKLEQFVDKYHLNFDLLSDIDHKIAEKYGVWGLKKLYGKEYEGIHRISFLIGKDGNIKYVMKKVKTKTHHEDMIKMIKDLL